MLDALDAIPAYDTCLGCDFSNMCGNCYIQTASIDYIESIYGPAVKVSQMGVQQVAFQPNVDIDHNNKTFATWSLVGQASVPVPAAVWPFGSGLVGLIVIAKRKKTA